MKPLKLLILLVILIVSFSCEKKSPKISEPNPSVPIPTPNPIGDIKVQILCSCTPGHTMYPVKDTKVYFYKYGNSNVTDPAKADWIVPTNSVGISIAKAYDENFVSISCTSTFVCSLGGPSTIRTMTTIVKPITNSIVSTTLIMNK